MNGAFSWEAFEAVPLVAILRGVSADRLAGVVDALRVGGLTTLEITMNTGGAAAQIRQVIEGYGAGFNVGAGTVTSVALLEEALAAGASFIVTPTVQPAVIQACVQRGVPVFPGALSPAEVAQAMDLGATWVKVFPADRLGPGYVRHLRTVLPQVRVMPTGGVDLDTLARFKDAGAEAFGLGSPLLDRARIEAGDWAWLADRARAFRRALEGGGDPGERSPARWIAEPGPA